MSASGAHYEAERAEHLRNADEELALGDGFVANELLHPVLNKEGGKEVENVEDVRITVGGVEFIPDGLSSSEALADAVLEARRAVLGALRRFAQNEARLTNGLELLDLLAADARLEAAQRALEEAG